MAVNCTETPSFTQPQHLRVTLAGRHLYGDIAMKEVMEHGPSTALPLAQVIIAPWMSSLSSIPSIGESLPALDLVACTPSPSGGQILSRAMDSYTTATTMPKKPTYVQLDLMGVIAEFGNDSYPQVKLPARILNLRLRTALSMTRRQRPEMLKV